MGKSSFLGHKPRHIKVHNSAGAACGYRTHAVNCLLIITERQRFTPRGTKQPCLLNSATIDCTPPSL
eukprot:4430007-Amphidinium_carterae.1